VPCYNYAFRKTGGYGLDTEQIIKLLKTERERIDKAITALEGGRSVKRTSHGSLTADGPQRKRQHLSAEARKRISDAQKKRWAKQKKAAK
jgi:exonuclease VII small subunit